MTPKDNSEVRALARRVISFKGNGVVTRLNGDESRFVEALANFISDRTQVMCGFLPIIVAESLRTSLDNQLAHERANPQTDPTGEKWVQGGRIDPSVYPHNGEGDLEILRKMAFCFAFTIVIFAKPDQVPPEVLSYLENHQIDVRLVLIAPDR